MLGRVDRCLEGHAFRSTRPPRLLPRQSRSRPKSWNRCATRRWTNAIRLLEQAPEELRASALKGQTLDYLREKTLRSCIDDSRVERALCIADAQTLESFMACKVGGPSTVTAPH